MDPLSPLIRLRNAADVLAKTDGGRLATPLATELFRSQRRLNTKIAEVCIDWLALKHEPNPIETLDALLQVEWAANLRSHRTGLASVAVRLAKAASIRGISPFLSRYFDAQQRFNEACKNAFRHLLREESPVAALFASTLTAVEKEGLRTAKLVPFLSPWIHSQHRFNVCLESTIKNEAELLVGSHEQAYQYWVRAGEPTTARSVRFRTLRWALSFRKTPTADCLKALPWKMANWSVHDSASTRAVSEFASRLATAQQWKTVDAVLVMDGCEKLRADKWQQWNAASSDIWFSDSDTIDASGRRSRPEFKPNFSPLLFSEFDCVGSVLAMRTSVFEALSADQHSAPMTVWSGFSKKYSCSRISKVLWHHNTDVTRSVEQHEYACQQHWNAQGALFDSKRYPRVTFPVPEGLTASLIIPFRDRIGLLQQLVDSLARHPPGLTYQLILLSNQSVEPETFAFLDKLALHPAFQVKITEWNQSFNFSAINNIGARHADGEVLVFLNNDIEFGRPQWLARMCGYAIQPDIGVVGAVLDYPDGSIQHAGVVVGVKGLAGHIFSRYRETQQSTAFGNPRVSRDLSAVTGACLAIKKDRFETVGGFDERFAVSGGDVELCLRTGRSGYRIVALSGLDITHHKSLTRKDQAVARSDIEAELQAYRLLLESGDPWYHPALTTASTTAIPWLDGETSLHRRLQFDEAPPHR